MPRILQILRRRRPQVEYIYVYDRPNRPDWVRRAR